MEMKQVKDMVRALQLAKGDKVHPRGKAIFLVGAGCSKSAGIPLGSEIVDECVKDLAKTYSQGLSELENATTDEALAWLKENDYFLNDSKPDELYGYIFENHYPAPPQQQRIIFQAIQRCDGKINWAHLCLGELVKQGYIHTVLTTNFDQLVLEGIIRTGILPVVADGVRSLTRVSSEPLHPQVVHLHGSMHTYDPLNSASSLKETGSDIEVAAAIYTLLRDSDVLVVIGYAGGEEGVMSLLVDASRRLQNNMIYWVQYGKNTSELSKNATSLLNCGKNKFLISEQDADSFFAEVMGGLEIRAPSWMKHPINALQMSAEKIKYSNNNKHIHGLIARYHKRLLGYREAENTENKKEKALGVIHELSLGKQHKDVLLQMQQEFDNSEDSEVWRKCADSAYELGRQDADPAWLEISIAAYQQTLTYMVKMPTEYWEGFYPFFGAEIQNKLGDALLVLGERGGNENLFKQALDAHTKALEVFSRVKTPKEWAKTQNKLGIALYSLGRQKNDKSLLDQSQEAFEEALKEFTHEKSPVDWAKTQNNLGNLYRKFGKLEESVSLFEKALEIFSPEVTPDDWAKTQGDLGITRLRLGQQRKDSMELKKAMIACENALKVYDNKKMRVSWAKTQSGLGNVLLTLGEFEQDITSLQQAETVLELALGVRTVEHMDVDNKKTLALLERTKNALNKFRIQTGASEHRA
jgi:tetratricopeptide (TPR) repeat protein